MEEICKGAIRAASLSSLTVPRDASPRLNKDARPVLTFFFAFLRTTKMRSKHQPTSDSPLRWRSSCWRCCKAPGRLAHPYLWAWHRSSSDPASAQNCSRCPALSSGGSRPRNLGKRKKTNMRCVEVGVEQILILERWSTCERKLPLTSGFIDSLLVKYQIDYLLLLMHNRRLIHALRFALITEESVPSLLRCDSVSQESLMMRPTYLDIFYPDETKW